MSSPTGIIGFSPSTPAAPSGRVNVRPQTDSSFPIQHFSFNMPNIGGVQSIATSTATISQANQGNAIIFSASSTAVSISNPTDANFYCWLFNNGAGNVTLTPASGQINGGSSLAMMPGADGILFWDGTNWWILLAGGPGTSLSLETNGTLNSTQTLLNLTGSAGISVSESAGTVTISGVGIGGASPSSRRWAYGASAAGGDLSTAAGHWVGDSGQNVSGSSSIVTPTGSSTYPCPVTALVTGSVSGNNALLISNSANTTTGWVQTGKNMLFMCYLAVSAITSVRIRIGVGMTNNATTWLNTDTITSVVFAAFRFSTNVPDTNWQCETGDGSAETVDDSGIAVTAATLYKLQIQFNDATPNVVFSINGTVVQTHTTHLPGANKALAFLTGLQTLTAAARTLNTSWIYEEADN